MVWKLIGSYYILTNDLNKSYEGWAKKHGGRYSTMFNGWIWDPQSYYWEILDRNLRLGLE